MNESNENVLRLVRDYLDYQMRMGFDEVVLPGTSQSQRTSRDLQAVRNELGECTRCPLSKTRKNIVFGEGNPSARLMFVGEGPGADEDATGRPFVGRAGQLLTKMIAAMGLDRSEVYIANVVKCRPPQNREPLSLEVETCMPFLEGQIAAINPEAIVALGRVAANALLETNAPLWKYRGRFHDRRGIPVLVTYHPSFLLQRDRDRQWKAKAWEDLKMVMAFLGLPLDNTGA